MTARDTLGSVAHDVVYDAAYWTCWPLGLPVRAYRLARRLQRTVTA